MEAVETCCIFWRWAFDFGVFVGEHILHLMGQYHGRFGALLSFHSLSSLVSLTAVQGFHSRQSPPVAHFTARYPARAIYLVYLFRYPEKQSVNGGTKFKGLLFVFDICLLLSYRRC